VTQSIYKYPISAQMDLTIQMPVDARVVHVGRDHSQQPCLWVLLTPGPATQSRKFGIYGTGGQVPDHWEYVGTYADLPYVWHVFEEKIGG